MQAKPRGYIGADARSGRRGERKRGRVAQPFAGR